MVEGQTLTNMGEYSAARFILQFVGSHSDAMRHMRGCFYRTCPLLRPELKSKLKESEARVDVFSVGMLMLVAAYTNANNNNNPTNTVFSPNDAWKWLTKVLNWAATQTTVPFYITQAICIILTGAAGSTDERKQELIARGLPTVIQVISDAFGKQYLQVLKEKLMKDIYRKTLPAKKNAAASRDIGMFLGLSKDETWHKK